MDCSYEWEWGMGLGKIEMAFDLDSQGVCGECFTCLTGISFPFQPVKLINQRLTCFCMCKLLATNYIAYTPEKREI